MQMGLIGELQLGQPRPNTLPLWETWCPPLPSIIAVGWSVKVITRVEYVIWTPQGSEKQILRFESCSEPWVAQQEFSWSEAAAMLGWVSSIGPTAPELKRSQDPDSLPTPSKQLPPQ